MTRILNKLFYYLKNILLPILLVATIFIIMQMFQRLDKNPFGANFFEFLEVIFPYILLIILLVVNIFLNNKEVKNNIFYNLVSFMVMLMITVFCYRALFDQNMLMWHRYKYQINFTYFTDQIAPMKVSLYLLAFANIMLIIKGYLNDSKEENKDNNPNIKIDKNEFKKEINYKNTKEDEIKEKLKKTLDTFE